MEHQIIATPDAPGAIGPYVQGRRVGDFIYTSGQIPFDGEGNLVGEDIECQTRRSLENVVAIVEAGGGSKETIIKNTVFMRDMSHFARMNAVYADFFGDYKPARSAVEVARLPKDVLIEIECIATVK